MNKMSFPLGNKSYKILSKKGIIIKRISFHFMLSVFNKYFLSWKERIIPLLKDWHYIFMLIFSLILLFLSSALSWYLSEQNDLWNSTTSVGDTLLQVLPYWDLSFLYTIGVISMIVGAILYSVFFDPKKLPLGILAVAILVFLRGFFINATHIGLPEGYIFPNTYGLNFLSFQNDLFFSGHTAAPFLAALLLWEKKSWRYFFLISSVVMAFTVLSMRLHYTIDIIGAYFITYGVFQFAQYLYHADRKWNQELKKWFLQF